MTNPDNTETLKQRLQAVDLVEHLLARDRARYLAIILHTDPRDLAHELAYVAALLVARIAGDDLGDPDDLARDRRVLAELRARIRLETDG